MRNTQSGSIDVEELQLQDQEILELKIETIEAQEETITTQEA